MTDAARATVLIVDDYADAADLYAEWLAPQYDVRTAYSGSEALDALGDEVDVVLLDRRMPGLSGEALLVEIRARDLDCRVAAVTGVEPDFDLIDMPVDAYLQKPVRRADLEETVRGLVQRSEYDDRLREYCGLASRKAALEARKSPVELERSEAYADLVDHLEAVEREVDAMVRDFDPEDFVKAFRDCVPPDGDEATSPS